MTRTLLAFFLGVAMTAAACQIVRSRTEPTFTRQGRGWTVEHIPMPECPNDLKRTFDAPERDEVDLFTIVCAGNGIANGLANSSTNRLPNR